MAATVQNESKKTRIIVLCPDPPGFSGQRNATEAVLKAVGATQRYELDVVKLAGIPKTGGGLVGMCKFAIANFAALFKILMVSLFMSPKGIFLALSQSNKTLVRDHFLVRMIRLLARNKQIPLVSRLDSSIFMSWSRDDALAEKFNQMLQECDLVTALGPRQKERLEQQYSSTTEYRVVPNTCDIECCSESDIENKNSNSRPVSVLHLSSLMEPKGYLEIVESAKQFADSTEVTICGTITKTEYDQRFGSVKEATDFLEKSVESGTNIRWVRGAIGAEKAALFERANVFVLPTRYPVESQPLVLLEAIAAGCTIVTTSIGEIGYIVDSSSAAILETGTAGEIAEVVKRLENNPNERIELAKAARRTFLTRFNIERFEENWTVLFDEIFRR